MGRDLEPVSNPILPYGHEEPRDLAGHFAGTWGVALSNDGRLAGPSLGQREKLPFIGRCSPTHTLMQDYKCHTRQGRERRSS